MKRIAKKHFKKAPPVGECTLAPSRHELFNVVKSKAARLEALATAKALELKIARDQLAEARDHAGKTKRTLDNREQNIATQRRDLTLKDMAIRELQDRIDWFVEQTKIRAASEAVAMEAKLPSPWRRTGQEQIT